MNHPFLGDGLYSVVLFARAVAVGINSPPSLQIGRRLAWPDEADAGIAFRWVRD